MGKIITYYEMFNHKVVFLGIISLFLMVVTDSYNVIAGLSKTLPHIPAGKSLIEEYAVIVTYIGLGFVMIERGHIRTEILIRKFSKSSKIYFDILTSTMVFIITAFISYNILNETMSSYIADIKIPAVITIYKWPFLLIVFIGFMNASLGSLFNVLKLFLKIKSKPLEAVK